MNFTQIEFVVFVAVVIAGAWACGRVGTRNGWLLLASYYFYAYWDWRFCGLLALSTAIDFTVARRIAAADDSATRRRWLTVSVVANMGMLAVFKYCNFFLDSLRSLGVADTSTLNIILPVGISFFTFQTLSYTIDVYRRKIPASDSWWNFALYVAFFPQLVAGPIVRAAMLLPQLAVVPVFSRRRLYGGFQQLLRGAVKKVLIADRLAETVDVVFAGPNLYDAPTLWLAVIAFAGQIYYDFSGYSDMAIGIAKMLGYRFPVNFRHPYLATSITDFWRRWHITLSTWLRDYLYVPLGGSRGTPSQSDRNRLITMTLGGLWHGAAMTFVLWGVWHGLALVVGRWCGWRPNPGVGATMGATRFSRIAGWSATAAVVLVGWVLFRAGGIDEAGMIGMRMAGVWSSGETGFALIRWMPPLTILAITLAVAEHAIWTTRWRSKMRLPHDWWASPIITAVMLWSIVLFAPGGFRPFVYFQF